MNNISILYEDNHLLVVVKPPNVLSQGDRTGDRDMLTMLKEYIKVTYNKPGNVYLGLVHRLDRPVGGVMVFAKTSKAASRLSEQVRHNQFGKEYLAVVWGHPSRLEGSLRDYLVKDRRSNMVKVTHPQEPGAKEAWLDYKVVDMAKEWSLLRIHLHTGRAHQIRVQLSTAGYPIVGDQRYGLRGEPRMQIGLWAESLSLVHPTTKEVLKFTAQLPNKIPWDVFELKA